MSTDRDKFVEIPFLSATLEFVRDVAMDIIRQEIDHLERRFYYDYYDCFCAEEMRNTHEVGCKYGQAVKRLAELRAQVDEARL